MQSDGTSFCFRCNLGFLFQTTDDAVYRIQEVLLAYEFLPVAGSDQCSLIADIGNICTRESRCLTCQQVHIYTIVYFNRAQMHAKYFFTFVQVGQIHVYLTVKTSCTEQCLVEYVYTVGSSKYNHTAIGTEAVHFCQQLVQCVFAFVISSHCRVLATGTSYGINLINKDDTGSFFFSLFKQVANTGCTYTHKHFHEVGTCQ